MNSFSERIRAIEAKLNQLKTQGLSSSSSLEVAEYTITVNWQIIAIRIGSGGEIFEVGASKDAYVRVRTKDRQPALICMRYISPLNFGERSIGQWRSLHYIGNNYDYCFDLYMYGDENDRQAIEGGQTLPTETYTFKILSTSELTGIDILYEDHPIYDGRNP